MCLSGKSHVSYISRNNLSDFRRRRCSPHVRDSNFLFLYFLFLSFLLMKKLCVSRNHLKTHHFKQAQRAVNWIKSINLINFKRSISLRRPIFHSHQLKYFGIPQKCSPLKELNNVLTTTVSLFPWMTAILFTFSAAKTTNISSSKSYLIPCHLILPPTRSTKRRRNLFYKSSDEICSACCLRYKQQKMMPEKLNQKLKV